MKATLVRELPRGGIDGEWKEGDWKGRASLYRCEPGGPLPELVIVSSVHDLLVHETYIFAADETGEVTDWSELPGSYRDGTDHVEALKGAGYEVTQ